MLLKKQHKKIAVHLHLHYVDLLQNITPYLKHVPVPFHLYVTITDPGSEQQILKTCRRALPRATTFVQVVKNKGRDVKPFYTDLRDKLQAYDFICHIHGKKSLFNNGATVGWLEHLLLHLFGSEKIVTAIFQKLQEDRTGLIYPPTFPGLPYWVHNWLSNTAQAHRLAERLKISRLPRNYFSYPVGNMFWARVDALKPLFDLNLKDEDYPEEKKQIDGEIMHALERMTTVVAASQGFSNHVIHLANGAPVFSVADEVIDYTAYDNSSLEHLKQAIEQPRVKVVSFDIFDTLVCRPLLEPDDMFDLMRSKVTAILGKKVPFKDIRRRADATLRAKLQKGTDITLEDIYTEIGRALKLDDAAVAALMQLELDVEKRLLCKRAAVVKVMEHAYAIGKRVVLTSDMYLTEKHLRALLDNLGIKAYHKIYISADVGHRKDTRTLFPYVLERENVLPEGLLHIGDNEHSDLQIPGDLGITVFHVKKARDLFLRSHLGRHVYKHRYDTIPLYYRGCLALAINKFYDDPFPKRSLFNADLELFGYFYFGPILLSYVKWVADTARKQHIKRLYFISRDGEILYKIYKLVQQHSKRNLPEAEYIEVSRRSLAIPFIKDRNDIDKALHANFFGESLKNYLHARLGIDITGISPERLRKYGFESIDEPIYIPADLEKVTPLAYSLYNENKNRFEDARDKAVRYLQGKGLFDKAKKSIVDIGYSGTMQRLLNRITRRPIHGLYMVTYNTIRSQITKLDVIANGLFADGVDPFSGAPSINKYSLFYEMVLSSVNGPVESYMETEAGIQPVYEPVAPEEAGKLQKMPRIHKGILDFCTDFAARFDGFDQVDYKDTAILQEAFAHFIEHPNKEDVLMLAGYTLDDHYCGNGVFYWVPTREQLENKSYDPQKCLWQKGIDVLFPDDKPFSDTAYTFDVSKKQLGSSLDKQILDWYAKEYEALPDWYKKVGHVVKLAKGTKRLKLVLEDTKPRTGGFASKAEEIQAWYDKEYEVTPAWYKKLGHLIKVVTGKKKWKDYL